MPKRRTKRNQAIYLTLVYMTMTILVVGIVGMLVLLTLGYDFDSKSGRLEQGGLIQLDSRPRGATVTFDGNRLGSTTSTKLTATSGDHSVTMQRTGYREWQKQISLRHGEVLWLNYARLIPTSLSPEPLTTYTTATRSSASANAKWYVISRDDGSPVLDRYDLSRDDARMQQVTIPNDIYTAPTEGRAQLFEPISWASNNRLLLVRHTYDDGVAEWLTVDVEDPSNSRNLTRQLGIQVKQIMFSANDASRLYIVTSAHELREIRLGEMSLSRVLADNIDSVAVADSDTLTYQTIADAHGERSVGYYTDGAARPRVIESFADSTQPLRVTLGKYFGDHYIAIMYGTRTTIQRTNLPSSASTSNYTMQRIAEVDAPAGATLSISSNQRFIVAENATSFAVYDLELKKYTTTAIDGVAPAHAPLRWLDPYHVWSMRDGVMRMYEFDGANIETLASGVVPSSDATLAQDGKYLYYMTTDATRGEQYLTRVKLIN